ncbi:MAG: endonuclease/exonuclease/phosphatase family protein [Pseudomonadota bacterium]|jgi:endonuclease/exonuclease/phosphatase family metal-dependent hydrolase|nr:endonuclease/exonuclease/phosphatase family protein [Xanthomonadaceae bacterium]MDE2247575.1 endonuclease/exonuclease/phosphatase family protein [Xanthomonadaceae bacterium]MDE3210219.1 endonuclease/exonuclease/phosphatase family protein [Pseudomonadota bacterium]
MTLHGCRLLLFLLICLGVAGPAVATGAPLRVMTFNVRVPVDRGMNAWEHRRELLVRVVRAQHPDVLGTQELTEEQGEYIAAHLPGYAWFGQGREGGSKGEHMGVFYRTDRLQLLRSGDFWLSDTPDVPGSRSWGQPYPRMVTWARFRLRHGGGAFDYFNTHFPYREQDVRARLLGADEILRRIGRLPPTARVILAGDFNAGPDSPVYAKLSATLHDAWVVARSRAGPAQTFHAFTGKPDRRIDWILSRGFQTRAVRTVTTHEGARYPSDHFPVVAELVPGR